MSLWTIVVHEDYPIWVIAHRLIERERLDSTRVKWLLEADGFVQFMPRKARGIISAEPMEPGLSARQLGVSSRTEAVALALKHHLVE